MSAPLDLNVPVVTSGGGTEAAYKDPKSPESLMKKTATMNVQANVDSTYDVKEGYRRYKSNNTYMFLAVFILTVVLILQDRFSTKKTPRTILWFLFALATFLLLRSFYLTE